MLEEHDRSSNHQLGEEGMNMTGNHMVMVEERPWNHWPEDEGMDIVQERPEVKGTDMVEVEREHKGVVLTKHWIGDGAKMHQQTHWERELVKSGC
jgi:hypothetical protein